MNYQNSSISSGLLKLFTVLANRLSNFDIIFEFESHLFGIIIFTKLSLTIRNHRKYITFINVVTDIVSTSTHPLSFLSLCVSVQLCKYKTSRPVVFFRKGVLKMWSQFTGEHPCRSAIAITLESNLLLSIT